MTAAERRKRITEALHVFVEHFDDYGKPMTPANAAIYHEGLASLTGDELIRGLSRALLECDRMPKVADIRRLGKADSPKPGSLIDTANRPDCPKCGGAGFTLKGVVRKIRGVATQLAAARPCSCRQRPAPELLRSPGPDRLPEGLGQIAEEAR